jgi:hypothetical protein
MKYILYSLILLLPILGACQENKEEQKSEEPTYTIDDNTTYTFKNPIKPTWAGAYTGVLPCEGCNGIQILITLEETGTSHCSIKMLGIDDDGETGVSRIRWEEEGVLGWIRWYDGDWRQYRFSENEITQLNENGMPYTGPFAHQYVLKRVE